MTERDPFAEFDARDVSARHPPRAETDSGAEDDGPPASAGPEFDFFATEHRLLGELEVARRQVRRNMAMRDGPATDEERALVRECWESAMAAWKENEAQREESGWAADDLVKPPPWRQVIEAELVVAPVPAVVGVEGGDAPEPSEKREDGRPEPDLSGRPLPLLAVALALRGYALGASIRGVEKDPEIGLTFQKARRVYSWAASGAAWFDLQERKPVTAPGYRFVTSGPKTKAGSLVKLIRSDPV